jgi:hypothetical protein
MYSREHSNNRRTPRLLAELAVLLLAGIVWFGTLAMSNEFGSPWRQIIAGGGFLAFVWLATVPARTRQRGPTQS